MALLVEQEVDDEQYRDLWSNRDREVFDQLRIKLNPEAQEEILRLNESLMQSPTEGEQLDREG